MCCEEADEREKVPLVSSLEDDGDGVCNGKGEASRNKITRLARGPAACSAFNCCLFGCMELGEVGLEGQPAQRSQAPAASLKRS